MQMNRLGLGSWSQIPHLIYLSYPRPFDTSSETRFRPEYRSHWDIWCRTAFCRITLFYASSLLTSPQNS